MFAPLDPTSLLASHSYSPPPSSDISILVKEVEVVLFSIEMSGSEVRSTLPLCLHVTVPGGGIPSKEQEIWSSLPRGTRTKSSLSAVTTGATGGRGGERGKDGRGGNKGRGEERI